MIDARNKAAEFMASIKDPACPICNRCAIQTLPGNQFNFPLDALLPCPAPAHDIRGAGSPPTEAPIDHIEYRQAHCRNCRTDLIILGEMPFPADTAKPQARSFIAGFIAGYRP